MYNLRVVKCRGLSCPYSLPFQLKETLPHSKAKLDSKLRFMKSINKEYYELYNAVISRTGNNIDKFASDFQKTYLSDNNYSLISCFCGRARSNFRLYWALFIPKVYKNIDEINFQERLRFKTREEKRKCMFIEE